MSTRTDLSPRNKAGVHTARTDDLRIREIRLTSGVPISSLDPSDPVRQRFGKLHGISMILLLAQALAGAVVVGARDPGLRIED